MPERINGSLESEGGVVAHKSMFSLSDHPVCAASVAARHFFDRAATPPLEEGNFAHDTLYMQSLYLSAGPFQRSPLSASSNTMPYLGLKVPAAPSAVTTALA